MRKLLNANFARLWKSKVFWVLELFAFLWGTAMYVMVYKNVQNIGMDWLLANADYYFFFVVLYMSALTAVFASLYIGTEYSDGTMRNKLVVGHCRRDVYLSNLTVTTIVTLIIMLTHFLAAIVVGIPAVGMDVLTAVDHIPLKIGCSLVVILAYASVFTLLAMLDTSKARCAVLSIVLALALILIGFAVFGTLAQPELTSKMVMQEDGSFLRQENIPNPRYVSGWMRSVLSTAEMFLPSAQGVRIASGKLSMPGVIGVFVLSMLLNMIGIMFFKKKDIK